jgi:hypothetical protein
MALPPEPLASVLPVAGRVVVGVVVAIDATDVGAWPEATHGPPDAAPPCPAQRATVQVLTVLCGDADRSDVVVVKPPAPYMLEVDVGGAFLLDTTTTPPTILGRYGPDTWGVDVVEAAITSAVPETP